MNHKKLLEMKAKREDLRLSAVAVLEKAEKEDRFLTDEENSAVKGFEEDILKWDESIKRAESVLAIAKSDNKNTDSSKDEEPEQTPLKPTPEKEEKGFRNLGEQLMAVYRSATPGAKVDEKLSTRAASGLNETNLSDGGFLVQQDFVSELLKKTFDTGILASKVKKYLFPLTQTAPR